MEQQFTDPSPQKLFAMLNRDPDSYPLFARLYDLLQFLPTSKYHDKEEYISYLADALDYLEVDGRYHLDTPAGRTQLYWDGQTLSVDADGPDGWQYQREIEIH